MNIIVSIKEDINSDLMSALASANNETIEKTKLTVETSIISLLLAFMKRASTETGLHLLYNLTKSGNFSIHNPLDSIFPGEKINKLADEGNALISKIIPDKKSPLITFVSSYSGVRNASANRTNGIVTLLVLNKLKEVTSSKALDLGGLAELFADQKDFLIENAPKTLIEKLSQHIGLGNLISLGSSIITTSATINIKTDRENQKGTDTPKYNVEQPSGGSGSNFKNWIIPLIFGLAIVGLGSYYYLFGINDDENITNAINADTLVNINDSIAIDSVKSITKDSLKISTTNDTVLVEMEEHKLPNGLKITLEKGNLSNEIINFLNDTTRINSKKIISSVPSFNNTGNSILAERIELFNEIGTIMKAYPSSRLKVLVNNYISSDSTSNANKKAFAIKRVLLNKGIQPIRIDAVGKYINIAQNNTLKANEVELTIMKK